MTIPILNEEQARGPNQLLEPLRSAVTNFVSMRLHYLQTDAPPITITEPPVLFEVGRFVFFYKVRVMDDVCTLLTKRVHQFAFQPDDKWHVDPVQHSIYTASLVLGIPTGLRSVWKMIGQKGALEGKHLDHWLKEHVAAICPYICPAS